MADNADEYLPEGEKYAGTVSQVQFLDAKKKLFADSYEKGMWQKIYDKVPDWVPPEIVAKYRLNEGQLTSFLDNMGL
jgi:hypothetical protein